MSLKAVQAIQGVIGNRHRLFLLTRAELCGFWYFMMLRISIISFWLVTHPVGAFGLLLFPFMPIKDG